jgi:hypothetical protein
MGRLGLEDGSSQFALTLATFHQTACGHIPKDINQMVCQFNGYSLRYAYSVRRVGD